MLISLFCPVSGIFQARATSFKDKGPFRWDFLTNQVLVKKKPVLGICLGMQLMAKHSEEGDAEGFGWFDAEIIRFRIKDTLRYKIPNIGWESAALQKQSLLMKGMRDDARFYFVHSYHIQCKNKEDVLATSEYEYIFTSAIQKGNIFGTQFHPEKSQDFRGTDF